MLRNVPLRAGARSAVVTAIEELLDGLLPDAARAAQRVHRRLGLAHWESQSSAFL
ncbi:hypothetical protein HUT06_02910 [Actinomadura sp. NAK00032]|uniref:hypothetical protein n=1 Tax=Actinomadura sp. NAK00032 TaxID=2742128 RepID=UPI001590E3AC|nr:hypothetical protein [Actinomadura sp. NAK00032]QKW33113.1 hypothetical protein HUT06_02910 [Actinomadura sp. NAK00032]